MNFIVFLFSFYAFLKTIGYGYYEYKKQNNKITGVAIIILSFVCLIGSNVLTFIGGQY